MADGEGEDDLDAFFDDVQQAESTAIVADESTDTTTATAAEAAKPTTPTITTAATEDNEPPTKKLKKDHLPLPIRPRGMVVAAASVKPASVVKPLQPGMPPPPAHQINPASAASQNRYYPLPPPPPPPPPPPARNPPQPPGASAGNPVSGMLVTVGPGPSIPVAVVAPVSQPQQKVSHKPHVRTAAGKTWVDNTLADWPTDDFRLFVGNLDPAVPDAQLFAHFSSKYASVQQVRIIRDNKTGVSQGYGFVSLTDALEMARALREMDQTWLGSRPIRLKRSHWKDRELHEQQQRKKRQKQKQKGLPQLLGHPH